MWHFTFITNIVYDIRFGLKCRNQIELLLNDSYFTHCLEHLFIYYCVCMLISIMWCNNITAYSSRVDWLTLYLLKGNIYNNSRIKNITDQAWRLCVWHHKHLTTFAEMNQALLSNKLCKYIYLQTQISYCYD